VGANAGTQLGVSTPDPVFIALDDDRHGDGTRFCHCSTITGRWGSREHDELLAELLA
jgi:hypothetical protein